MDAELLRHMPGTVTVCKRSTRKQARPEFVAELIPDPLEGESNEVPMP